MAQEKDNPKVTAYALGELDPSESGAVEQELRASGTYDEVMDEYRELEGLLTDSFAIEEAEESELGLDANRRTAIEKRLEKVAGLRERRHETVPTWRRISVWLPFLLIILLLVIVAWIGGALIEAMQHQNASGGGSDDTPTPTSPPTAPTE